MQALDKLLRNILERTVKAARDTAETAARIALEQLGVGEPSAYSHLSDAERKLRRKLRAHGRQFGNGRDTKGHQVLDRLIEEVAYEHWHRMLFARFLAENDLLMYPDPDDPVAVTLEECEDLAADEGAANGWELASRYAARMLPQIFRLDSPVFQLVLPPENQQKLELLLADLPIEVFTASDSLGWVYQFWQAKKKDEVNASEVKIGAKELPAVTQLFTEPYMVSFLLDNSLGAWWAAHRLTETDLKNATNEEELRNKAAIPGIPLDYLRFVQQDDGIWTPAAGTFDRWPDNLSELKTLDPCCGSGHFLVAAFMMIVPMRMEREGLSAREAVDIVLRENIHGLELDQRCVELAAFAIALTAWKYPGAGGYRPLPELNVACSGLSVSVAKEEWKQLGLGRKNLTIALDWMHDMFKDAPLLGSLLNPTETDVAKLVPWDELSKVLGHALRQEQTDEQQEATVVAQGLSKATMLLSEQYQWVITNVPYLARGKQCEKLRDFCEKRYPAAKNDQATVFLERCVELCVKGGTSSIVLPQNWLFLISYKKLREKLLKNHTWHLIARLGPGAFDTISGEVVKAILFNISSGNISKQHEDLFSGAKDSNLIHGVDVSEVRTPSEKATGLLSTDIKSVKQANQLENPDARVVLEEEVDLPLLSNFAAGLVGIQTGDDPRYLSTFWETKWKDEIWEPMQHTPNVYAEYAGQSWLLRWDLGDGDLQKSKGARIQGLDAFGRNGVAMHRMGTLFPYHFSTNYYHQNIATIVPNDDTHLPAIWCFCSSPEYSEAVRRIDQKLNVTNATLVKVPFDLDHWINVAAEEYPNGLPMPYSNDPTQWIFHGHPCGSVMWDEKSKRTTHSPPRCDDTVLHVVVARLLGYCWPAELDDNMELAHEQREWVNRCNALLPYGDDDGIVCIPPVRGEPSAADRLLNMLAVAYGDAWSSDTQAQVLKSVDHGGKSLETWLRDKFFTQHCKLFHHRPFIWHIWDGLRDGFAAIVNYHKLNYKNLETLIYTYLGDWIKRQTQDIANSVDGAEERLSASESLKKKLELILEGDAPHDIFVRWKPIEKQPIGWNPNLNDGVRLNIRPFMTVDDVKKRGAGVLRDKPNIKWSKDRGKDDIFAPWYHLFKGDRINDYHLSISEKKAARLTKKSEAS